MRRRTLGVGAVALAAFMGGCGEADVPMSAASITVRGSALSAADITRVVITITAADIPRPITQDLVGDAVSGWSGTINDIPAGIGRTFIGEAYEGTTLIYEGVASPVTTLAGDTALVTIFLQQVAPPVPFDNAAPRFTGLSVSSYTVAPGGTVTLSVTAQDPDPNDTLTYAWSSPAGTFSDPAIPNPIWTAPATEGSVGLMVGASDSQGATATLQIVITVANSAAAAYVSVDVNSAPEIVNILPSPSQLFDYYAYVYLDLTATDPEGDSLTFLWRAAFPCEGEFDSDIAEDPTFTLAALDAEWDDCEVTVTVFDGRGGENTGTITLATGPGPCGGPQCGPPPVLPGQLLADGTATLSFPLDMVAGVNVNPLTDELVIVASNLGVGEQAVSLFFDQDANFLRWDSINILERTEVRAVATSQGGDGFVVGTYPDYTPERAFVRRVGGWTLLDWQWTADGAGAFDVAVDRAGWAWVMTVLDEPGVAPGRRAKLHRFNARLGTQDRLPVELGSSNPRSTGGVALDLAGNVVACSSDVSHASVWIDKFDVDLNPRFSVEYGADDGHVKICNDVVVDGLGYITVVGELDGDSWVARFDPTGNFVNQVIGTGDQSPALDVVVASNGILYVTASAPGVQPSIRALRPTLASYWTANVMGDVAARCTLDPGTGDLFYSGMVGTIPAAQLQRFAP
ncbi:MAG: hypothetical protein KC933_30455 [Myxococcales bacterium]|nr:hypothetical protein [Myxococcales bacterium]